MTDHRTTIARQIATFDKNLFRARDLEWLLLVLAAARDYGLNPLLMGSAADNAREGNPRIYNDIDLLIPNNPQDPDHERKLSLFAASVAPSEAFTSELPIGEALAEQDQDQDLSPRLGGQYCWAVLGDRFSVPTRPGRADIDICLESADEVPYTPLPARVLNLEELVPGLLVPKGKDPFSGEDYPTFVPFFYLPNVNLVIGVPSDWQERLNRSNE